MTIAVCMTTHNRAEVTARCLESLSAACEQVRHDCSLFVVDGGSTDGTVERVLEAWPSANVVRGDDSIYWARGTRIAMQRAVSGGAEFIFWLNDDTILGSDALLRLLEGVNGPNGDIAIGATRSPSHEGVTYCGYVRRRGLRLKLRPLGEGSQARLCDTMNGNAVLITRRAVNVVGLVDPVFVHGLGDLDYGLRASSAGLKLVQIAGTVGRCARDHSAPKKTTRILAFRRMLQPKGLPPRAWWVYTRRHAGGMWPIEFMAPYLSALLRGV